MTAVWAVLFSVVIVCVVPVGLIGLFLGLADSGTE